MLTVDFSRLDIPADAPAGSFRILDIGCGSGRHSGAAIQYPATLTIGADIKWTDVVQARQRIHEHRYMGVCKGRWGLTTTDVTALPFENACFDLVICAEVLEHILDHHQAIRELVRVLKPAGDLVVSVPRFWPEALCWLLSRQYRTSEGGHIRIFRRHALVRRVTSNGMHLRGTHHAHGLHAPFWWLKCLVGPERIDSRLVNSYHRLLVWDMMQRPRTTVLLERLLNPVMGKSLVMYFKKNGSGNARPS